MVKMKFIGLADKQEHLVIVDDHDRDDGIYTVELDGQKFKVDAKTMPSSIVTLLIDNKSYDIDVDDLDQSKDPLEGRFSVRVRGRVVRLEMLEERRKKMKDAAGSHFALTGISNIISPMPGKILRYLVEAGQEVKEGQGLVVVEAMKMENELTAPKDGTVKKLCSTPGSAVDGGALLLVIE
jgi:biotin carboxyl carrier protein